MWPFKKKNKSKGKNQLDILFEAYKLGGLPLVMLLIGASFLGIGFGDTLINFLPNVRPEILLLMGTILVLFSMVAWLFESWQKNKLILSLFELVNSFIEGAKQVSKSGLEYHAALGEAKQNLEWLLSVLDKKRLDTQNK